jgi:hypothetical protein
MKESVEGPSSVVAGRSVTASGWLTIAIGITHLIVGVASSSRLSQGFLWFEGSGIAVILIGGLTVLVRRRAPDTALYRFTLAANAVGIALGLVFCIITDWREPQGVALIVLFTSALAGCLSLRREAPIR